MESQLRDDDAPSRYMTVNEVGGEWTDGDLGKLMKALGHDSICRASSYFGVWQKCFRSFRQLENDGVYVTRNSRERSQFAGVLDRWSSSPILVLSFWGTTLASCGYFISRLASK